MAGREFAQVVAAVAEGMGQRPDAVRESSDGLLLHTTEGFLFAFVEDPDLLSLAGIERILAEPGSAPGRLVVLTPGRIPLALAEAVQARGGSLVEHERFRELLRGLDLGPLIGEEPRGPHDRPGARLLPSARRLDAVVARARTWFDWGVPALALRFYREALDQKPEFLPARIGVGRSLAALGLEEEAMATFRKVLEERPGDPDARLGEAAVHAAAHRTSEEVRIYRELLEEHPGRLDVRAQLVAAEIDAGRWAEARREIEPLLEATPEDPRIRFLHAIALRKGGETDAGDRQLAQARNLGLSAKDEATLRGHLGLPDEPRPAAPPTPPAPAARKGAPTAAAKARPKPRGTSRARPAPAPGPKRSGRRKSTR